MEKSQDMNFQLPPQGDFGTPSGRHGGEPDAALSSSCEGTAGVGSPSAPVAQATTGEQDRAGSASDDDAMEEDVLVHRTGEKRKASLSPDIEDDDAEEIFVKRPIKTRVFVSRSDDSGGSLKQFSSNTDEEADEEADVGETPVLRSSARKKSQADFKQLVDARVRKAEGTRPVGSMIYSDSESVDRIDSIIDPIVSRIREEESQQRASKQSSIESEAMYISPERCDTGSNASFTIDSKEKKGKVAKNKEADTDAEFSDSAQKKNRKRRTSFPTVVTKEEVFRELRYTREEWLKMDGAELGARGLDHLNELEKQRSISSNLAGPVSGKMRDCRVIVAEITKTLVEKLATTGDVYGLRTENQRLTEELAEMKRKEEARNKELIALRRTIANLEKEVRSLKEGFGPFTAAAPPLPTAKFAKRRITPDSARGKDKKKVSLDSPKNCNVAQVSEILSNTPGCSTDDKYMNRHEWPVGEDSTSWLPDLDRRASKSSMVKSSDIENSSSRIHSNVNPSSRTKNIRIIEDRQLIPPSLPPPEAEWRKISRRKVLRAEGRLNSVKSSDATTTPLRSGRKVGKDKSRPAKKFIRPAVVTITNKDSGSSYAEIFSKAREKVSLKEIGISETVVRRAINGAIVIEVPGPSGKQLAMVLKTRLAEALEGEARVANPVPIGELRIRGIDPSTSTEDILDEMVALGREKPESGHQPRRAHFSMLDAPSDKVDVNYVHYAR